MTSYKIVTVAEYNLPNICAWCGTRQGATMKKITIHKMTNYFMKIPICDKCSEITAKTSKSMGAVISGLFIISILMSAFLFLFFSLEGMSMLAKFILGGMLGFLASFFLMIPVGVFSNSIIKQKMKPFMEENNMVSCDDRGVVNFNGKVLTFQNKEFHRQFSILNPNLV